MKTLYIKRLYIIGVVMTLLLIAICKSAGGIQTYVYPLLLLESAIILNAVWSDKAKVILSRNEKTFCALFVAAQLLMFVISTIKYEAFIFDIHKLILFVGMVYACYFKPKRASYSYKQFDRILSMLVLLGIFACAYNFVINIKYFRLGSLSTIMYYTWNFSSFFFTRATYGLFLSFSAIAALVKSEKRKSKKYLLIYIFFVGNIILTGARAQMISVLLGSVIYLAYSKTYRKFVIAGSIILVMVLAIYAGSFLRNTAGNFINQYLLFFDHSQGGATDITTGRLYLWQQAISHMDTLSFCFGHGLGSRDTIMLKENIQVLGETLTSFHSGYVDLFFETGILGVGFYFIAIKNTIKKLKDIINKDIRHVFYGVITVVLIASVFDSNALFFTTDVFSPIVSVLAIALPNAIANTDKNRLLEREND